MGLQHFAVHQLEREIADVVSKGFSPKMDKADALQLGHDVADMMMVKYRIEVHPRLDENDDVATAGNYPSIKSLSDAHDLAAALPKKGHVSLATALHSLAAGLEGVRDGLRLCAGLTGEERP